MNVCFLLLTNMCADFGKPFFKGYRIVQLCIVPDSLGC